MQARTILEYIKSWSTHAEVAGYEVDRMSLLILDNSTHVPISTKDLTNSRMQRGRVIAKFLANQLGAEAKADVQAR